MQKRKARLKPRQGQGIHPFAPTPNSAQTMTTLLHKDSWNKRGICFQDPLLRFHVSLQGSLLLLPMGVSNPVSQATNSCRQPKVMLIDPFYRLPWWKNWPVLLYYPEIHLPMDSVHNHVGVLIFQSTKNVLLVLLVLQGNKKETTRLMGGPSCSTLPVESGLETEAPQT